MLTESSYGRCCFECSVSFSYLLKQSSLDTTKDEFLPHLPTARSPYSTETRVRLIYWINPPLLDGNWADNGYHVLFLGKGSSAVSQLTIVSGRIWAAYRNCVVIIEPKTLMIEVRYLSCSFMFSRMSLWPIPDETVKSGTWRGLEMECGSLFDWILPYGYIMHIAISTCKILTLNLTSRKC